MAVVKIKVDDTTYEVDGEKLNLGESWLMEREYGVDPSEPMTGFASFIGLLAIAMRRADPSLTEKKAKEQVEELTDERLEIVTEEPVPEVPTAAATAKASGKKKGGGQVKTRGGSGDQS